MVLATLLSCTIASFSSIASAEPAWKKTIPAFSAGKQPALKPQKLDYVMSWNGKLNSGRLTMIFDKEGAHYKDLYVSQAYGRSTGLASLLFPFVFNYTSFTKPGTYEPVVFVSEETDKEDTTRIENKYQKSSTSHSRTITDKKTSKVEKKPKKVFKQRNTHDPLSAMLYLRGRELKNGQVVNLCLFPFRSAQYAQVTVLGREKHNGYACIKLDLRIRNVDYDTHELKEYKKLKKATIWITDDEDRILVELRSKVFIGDVRTVLKKRG